MTEIERILSETPKDKIRDTLETYAAHVSRDTVPRYFTEKELLERKEELSGNLVAIREASLVLAKAKSVYKWLPIQDRG
jgi:hypothetical protein